MSHRHDQASKQTMISWLWRRQCRLQRVYFQLSVIISQTQIINYPFFGTFFWVCVWFDFSYLISIYQSSSVNQNVNLSKISVFQRKFVYFSRSVKVDKLVSKNLGNHKEWIIRIIDCARFRLPYNFSAFVLKNVLKFDVVLLKTKSLQN